MSRTGFVFHADATRHLTGADHVEQPERVLVMVRRAQESGLLDEMIRAAPEPAALEWIEAVHSARYIHRVEEACEAGRPSMDSPDTLISPGSYRAALLAAGGGLLAADRIMDGGWANAFVVCRPPGHHAERDRAMGFCLFNNAAITASYLRTRHGLERVAIVDWDVHHGNGTQNMFLADRSVYYLSLHQWPLYPGTGRAEERGLGEAHGTNLNCLMEPGAGDDDYFRTLEEQVIPELQRFEPECLVLSAGFDAHASDPLSATRVTAAGFKRMTRLLLQGTDETVAGRCLALLEGGYHLKALADSVEGHLGELVEAGGSSSGV